MNKEDEILELLSYYEKDSEGAYSDKPNQYWFGRLSICEDLYRKILRIIKGDSND